MVMGPGYTKIWLNVKMLLTDILGTELLEVNLKSSYC